MKKITFTLALTFIFYLTFSQDITLDLKVFLEVPFNGTEMNTEINNDGLVPLLQPYNTEPWNYTGTENVGTIPNTDIVDWILIELRETSGSAATAIPPSVIARQACFLLKNGQIVDIDGLGDDYLIIGSDTGFFEMNLPAGVPVSPTVATVRGDTVYESVELYVEMVFTVLADGVSDNFYIGTENGLWYSDLNGLDLK